MKEKAPLGIPFIGEPRGGRPTKGGDGRLATHFDWPAMLWPQFSSTFHQPPNLHPLMLKQLTKSIKSKENFSHLFPEFFLFL
jgi:hypothetical protein